jgi:hypothetical protein
VVEKTAGVKGYSPAIVTDKVRSYANDPTFLKRARETKGALSKTDLSILKKK